MINLMTVLHWSFWRIVGLQWLWWELVWRFYSTF